MRQRGWRGGLVLTAMLLSMATAWGGESAPDEWLSEVYQRVQTQDLRPDDSGCGPILKVHSGTPAQRAGLQEGDLILALNGYRIWDCPTYTLVRYEVGDPYDTDVVLTVRRGDEILDLPMSLAGPIIVQGDDIQFGPVRLLGHWMVNDPERGMDALLDAMNVTYPGRMAAHLHFFPSRARDQLASWRSENPDADLAWLNEFITLFTMVSDGRWQEAKAPAVTPPIPLFEKLTRFYLMLAEQQRADPKAFGRWEDLGVPVEFYAMYYPYPVVDIPPLGKLDFSDKEFLKYLALTRVYGNVYSKERKDYINGVYRRDDTRGDLDRHLNNCIRSLVEGYLFEYEGDEIEEEKYRQKNLPALRTLVQIASPDMPFHRYVLVCALLHEDALDEMKPHLVKLNEESPYLLYRFARILDAVQERMPKERPGPIREVLREQFHLPTPHAQEEALRYIDQRSRHIAVWWLQKCSPAALRWRDANFWVQALRRPQTLKDMYECLKAEVDAAVLPEQRAELMRRVVDLSKYRPWSDDSKLLCKLVRDGEGYGLYLESFLDMLFWHFALTSRKEQWIHEAHGPVYQGRETDTLPKTRQALQELDWNAPDVLKQVRVIFERWGRPSSTLLIADELDRHGQSDEARIYRDKVIRLLEYATFHHGRQFRGKKKEGYAWWPYHAVAHLHWSPATEDLAIEYARTYEERMPEDKQWDSVHLWLAQIYLRKGNVRRAASLLVKSFDGQPDNDIVFHMGDSLTTDIDQYRAWLLKSIAAHPRFNDSIKKRMLESKQLLSNMPDEVQECLGVQLTPEQKEQDLF